MQRLLKRSLWSIAAVAGLWLVCGLILIATAAPIFADKAFVIHPPALSGCIESATTRCFIARDGKELHAEFIAAPDKAAVLFLHGIMSSAAELHGASQALHAATGAEIVSLDLRGHGASAGTFGDIDYIGQYEEDVADVVAQMHKSNPKQRLILAGHSMGGGVAMRYAAKGGLPVVDGYLLFAPHLGDASPTSRNTATASGTIEAPIKLHLRRTLGLVMLNTVGITAFNGLGTLYFNVAADTGLLYYSFRAMVSCAPNDYRVALGADDKPLLIVAGSRDEAFDASQYPVVAQLHRNAQTVIVPDETHDGILSSPAAMTAVATWLR
jgi:pimeloyl-ACP methyl ester carboxylesterase